MERQTPRQRRESNHLAGSFSYRPRGNRGGHSDISELPGFAENLPYRPRETRAGNSGVSESTKPEAAEVAGPSRADARRMRVRPRFQEVEEFEESEEYEDDTRNARNGRGRKVTPEAGASSRSQRRGHDYRYITTQSNARTHLGDTYIEKQNVYSHPADEDEGTKEQKRRDGFLKALGFDLMGSRLATIGAAHAESCRWLFDREEYMRWKNSRHRHSNHGFLWIKGKPGAGKSTLMKCALLHRQKGNHPNSTIISFFFNARGHDLEKTTEGMYRSLLHQLFAKHPHRLETPLPQSAVTMEQQGWPIPMLQNMLRDVVLSFTTEKKLIVYIDALDECAEDAIRQAIHFFEDLGSSAVAKAINLSVCFASRHYPRIGIRRHETINLDVIKEHQDDISSYVEDTLHGTDAVKKQLGAQISLRCSGVFMWAALVVQIINEKMDRGSTRFQLQAELQAVPNGMRELLQSILLDQGPFLLPTLQWVLFSERPLTVPELYCAIIASAGRLITTVWDRAEITNKQMRDFILTSSKGLVNFTSRVYTRKGQFIHESVREYLLGGGLAALDSSLPEDPSPTCHLRLMMCCQHHIGFLDEHLRLQDVAKGRLGHKEMTRRAPLLHYALHGLIHHMEKAYEGGALALELVDKMDWSAWTWIVNISEWPGYESPTLLYILLVHGHKVLAKSLLQRQLTKSRHACHGQSDTTALADTTELGNVAVIDVNKQCGGFSGTALMLAVLSEDLSLVQILLDCGANPNHLSTSAVVPARSPLVEASARRSVRIVELLLEYGAHPNGGRSNYGAPLTEAARTGEVENARLLVVHGGDANGSFPSRPLHAAVHSNVAAVRLLLNAGADPNSRDQHSCTALHIAASTRGRIGGQRANSGTKYPKAHVEIAQALIDAGADINATDDHHRTALLRAYDDEEMYLVRLFVDRGADLSFSGHEDVVRRLRRWEKKISGPASEESDSNISTVATIGDW